MWLFALIPFIWLSFSLFLCCSLMMLICLLQFLLSTILLFPPVCRDPLMAHGAAPSQHLIPGQRWYRFLVAVASEEAFCSSLHRSARVDLLRGGGEVVPCITLHRGLVSCLSEMSSNRSLCTRHLKWDSNFSQRSLPFHLEHKMLAFLNTARW